MSFIYSPRAALSRLLSSSWMPGLTRPRRRIILVLSMVKSFFILKTAVFFNPLWEKSGWSGVSRKSTTASSPEGITEEIKAMTTSSSCGSGDTITAGSQFFRNEVAKREGDEHDVASLKASSGHINRILHRLRWCKCLRQNG